MGGVGELTTWQAERAAGAGAVPFDCASFDYTQDGQGRRCSWFVARGSWFPALNLLVRDKRGSWFIIGGFCYS